MSKGCYTGEQIEKINSENTPNDNEVIFRYMDFSKYIEILENSRLYFCYSKNFEAIESNLEPPFYIRKISSDNVETYINRRVNEIYKLATYDYENEIRAVYIDVSKECGLDFNVNLSDLINEIYFSPYSPKWFRDLVKKITLDEKYCLKGKVAFHDSTILI